MKKDESKSFFTKFTESKKVITLIDSELFELLKKIRLDLDNKEKVQAYLIFNNKVLEDMCSLRPKTKEQRSCLNKRSL